MVGRSEKRPIQKPPSINLPSIIDQITTSHTFLFPDCPNNGLCCFDGCADTCVDGPKPEPQPVQVEEEEVPAPLVPEPVEAETEVKPESEEPGYEYPVPEVPLELPKPSPPPPGLPTLYGAPPI